MSWSLGIFAVDPIKSEVYYFAMEFADLLNIAQQNDGMMQSLYFHKMDV